MSFHSLGRLKYVWLVVGLFCVALPSRAVAASPAGSLIQMQMQSTIGLLLDEVPAGALRNEAAKNALTAGSAFWIAKAQRQIRLANYRLVFRGGFYDDPKGPLPLPAKSVWNIVLRGTPRRQVISGHDYVAVDYGFQTYLVTDTDSPAAVEPALAEVGGTWQEPLILPIDPDLLFERTG